jgi:hypothetical protein
MRSFGGNWSDTGNCYEGNRPVRQGFRPVRLHSDGDVAAREAGLAAGTGVVHVEGKPIEIPAAERATRVLARAEAIAA